MFGLIMPGRWIMIRLKGQDAVNEAFWFLGESPNLPKAAFFRFAADGGRKQIAPEEIQKLVSGNRARPEEFLCEVPCVWDMIEGCEQRQFQIPALPLAIYPGTGHAIVQNRFFGAEVCPGSRWFAVLRSVYDSAVRWAKGTPVIEPEYSEDEFMNRLFPRVFLRTGAWRADPFLLKTSREIGEHLLDIFGLPGDRLSEQPQLRLGKSEEPGGCDDALFYDRVLEIIRVQSLPESSTEKK